MDDQHLDGNGVAALLAELAAADMTSVERTCQSCGAVSAVGEHRAHRGAGVVLRCPSCEDVAIVIGLRGDDLVVEWRGTYVVRR